MARRHNYKNLKIWSVAIEIAFEISNVVEGFPKHEQYNLISQMSRYSISMPGNIAEGSSRTDKSFSHFINIALGSSFELSTQLLIAHHKNHVTEELLIDIEQKIEEWQRMTTSFQNGLNI